jgi:hypothetical protein
MPEYDIGEAPDATIVGYAYLPTGTSQTYTAKTYLPSEVAHYAPEPDPLARFRGRSWMRSVLSEVDTDRQMTAHKAKFLERGVPPYAIKYPEEVTRGADGSERGKQIIEQFRENADVLSVQAGAIRTLVDGGFEETSVVKAITGNDLSLLTHTGLVPVQLQPPGSSLEPKRELPAPPPNISVDARTNVAMPVDARSQIDLAEVTFTPPNIEVAAPEVRVEAPEITVSAPPPAEITVNVPELPFRSVKKTVHRNKDGIITSVTEDEVRG